MNKSQRLLPIKELADSHEKLAAQQLGHTQLTLNQEQQRLEELIQYKSDYTNRFSQQGKNGISGAQIQQYQSFIAKLEAAIEHQKKQISILFAQRDKARDHWQEKHNRTKALEKSISRFEKDEMDRANRKEQRAVEDTYQARLSKTTD